MNSFHQPIAQNNRTIIVDVLRGWAIFGVVLMNYFDFFTLGRNWENFKPDTITKVLMFITSTFFSAKSWTLLSVLFGYGFAVLMDKLKEKGHRPHLFFAGRMFWLLILAGINSALFFGDILKDYAILGLLLLFFYRSSAKTIFLVSMILFLGLPALASYIYSLNSSGWSQMPALFPLYLSNNLADVLWFGLKGTWIAQMISKPYLYTVHVVMFCCMLWGFSLYRINFFKTLEHQLKYVKRAFWIALSAAILLTLYFQMGLSVKLNFMKHYNVYYWLILSTMIAIASGICWLYIAGKLKRFFLHLAFMGKMTLTNYMVQNLIGLLVFSGFGLKIWNTYPLWFYLALAVFVYIVQVFISKWWLSKYHYGPIEWIWRQLSYRKRLPLRR